MVMKALIVVHGMGEFIRREVVSLIDGVLYLSPSMNGKI